ncbi:MAG: xanthine dehydrogenase family protein subunit M [Vicinamibacterales bacterium]|jgi:xanthine dehydrogenase YagS FAD-binding subunit|nr:molybdopterin dehydrogenase [Acidobacteriota bacterium]MDP7471535.1 xanthine dehydrogenase family protein subunit M [Vicinamibacterales bacterium]MDP7671754.1 xanthine dehydrogenase family protein subunit M [Vicinamibacterales bacterium]HJO39809.1 xanthine dehydrogenase family protein subunit M [Vicinamibacterales bacterium]|tara:strand:+ start:1424 stop:2413 length:990 start_codon:yes stop_codon:yes gene_type:complete
MANDMMPHFELLQPADLETALELVDRWGERGWALAGGHDSLGWFKDRTKRPDAVIDLEGVAELKGIRETSDGIEIGAMTTLTEIERNAILRDRYGLLADAARRVASPQIRNTGTLGGNLCQDTRCWYYRYGLDCYRAGGNVCYADTPVAMNREHAVFEANRCVAVSPSDTATALAALDASMVIRSARGERLVGVEDFFMPPAVDITRMTVLEPGDILTAIRIPGTWAGARFYFEKVADRNSWDFALVSVASALKVEASGTIEDVRIACGAVQCTPRRLTDVENLVRGRAHNEETADLAAAAAADGARPLNYNHYKIPLVQNLVKRALRA